MTIRRFPGWAACLVLAALFTGCHTRSQVVAVNPALNLSPTCTNAVSVFPDPAHVLYDYYEVALITAEGNAAYNGNGDVLKAMRAKAALAGANGVIVDALGASHATVKVIGSVLGSDHADRKGRAIAIWMPSDTARVREVCGR